jgi:hypothetical protein
LRGLRVWRVQETAQLLLANAYPYQRPQNKVAAPTTHRVPLFL